MESRFPNRLSLAASLASLAAAWVFLNWIVLAFPQLNDDAHITFRVARNLADGNGMVYNPDERRQVTSTPLYCLLLAGSRRILDVEITNAARAWEFVFLSLSMALLWWMVVELGYGRWAWLVPLLMVTEPVVVFLSHGMESAAFMTFVLATLFALGHQRPVWAAAFLAGAALTRLDGAIAGALVAAVGLLEWARRKRSLRSSVSTLTIQAAVFAALTLPWFVVAWFYFGHPFPVSIGHKMSQTRSLGLTPFAVALVRDFVWDPRLGLPYLRTLPVLVGAAALVLKRTPRFWLLEWCALYLAAYVLARMPFYLWYQFPLYLPAIAMIVIGVAEIERWLSRVGEKGIWTTRVVPSALALLLIAQAAVPWRGLAWVAAAPDDSPYRDTKHYRAIGRFLSEYAYKDQVVASFEVGLIGYYSGRRILDLTGLTTTLSEEERRLNSLELVLKRKADFLVMEKWVYDKYPPEMRERFENEYVPIQATDEPDSPEDVLGFERWDSLGRWIHIL